MCGIVGMIAKDSSGLGENLINMLKVIEHRGRDATGFAVWEIREDVQIRVSLQSMSDEAELLNIVHKYGETSSARCYQGVGVFFFYEGTVSMDPTKIYQLHNEVDANPNLCVHSLGSKLKIYKDRGSARDLETAHKFNIGAATHGVGHVRLATESVDNINFAHPFISYLYPDFCIVHNGQFTNYFNLRRSLEAKGVKFKTNNDSEIAAHYLAYLMKEKGEDLEGAMRVAQDTFDGVFTIIAATSEQIGGFRDPLGIKPLLSYEMKDGTVLLGSEEISFATVTSNINVSEMEPGGIAVWNV